MRVSIDIPAADLLQQELSRYRHSELGVPLRIETVPGNAQITVQHALTAFSVHEGEGVLLIAAHPHLAPGSPLHSMLQQREIDGRALALFGMRQWRSDEVALVQARRIQSYGMVEISREGLQEMTDAVMSYVRSWQRFHLVLDLSVVDPVFAPGLTAPVPGGLTSRELLYVIQRLRLIRTMGDAHVIIAASPDPQTYRLVAHIIAELSAAP